MGRASFCLEPWARPRQAEDEPRFVRPREGSAPHLELGLFGLLDAPSDAYRCRFRSFLTGRRKGIRRCSYRLP